MSSRYAFGRVVTHLDRFSVAAALAIWLFCGYAATAQQNLSSLAVQVRKVEVNNLRTPFYRGVTTDNRANVKDDWLQIQVEYRTKGAPDGWLDEIELVWHVALLPKGKKAVVMTRAVTYVDIEDNTHYAAVYVRPKLLRRLFGTTRFSNRDVQVFAELKAGGKVVADSYGGLKPKTAWWQYQPPRVERRDDELLHRLETPFAPLDYDFYEHIKVQAKK